MKEGEIEPSRRPGFLEHATTVPCDLRGRWTLPGETCSGSYRDIAWLRFRSGFTARFEIAKSCVLLFSRRFWRGFVRCHFRTFEYSVVIEPIILPMILGVTSHGLWFKLSERVTIFVFENKRDFARCFTGVTFGNSLVIQSILLAILVEVRSHWRYFAVDSRSRKWNVSDEIYSFFRTKPVTSFTLKIHSLFFGRINWRTLDFSLVNQADLSSVAWNRRISAKTQSKWNRKSVQGLHVHLQCGLELGKSRTPSDRMLPLSLSLQFCLFLFLYFYSAFYSFLLPFVPVSREEKSDNYRKGAEIAKEIGRVVLPSCIQEKLMFPCWKHLWSIRGGWGQWYGEILWFLVKKLPRCNLSFWM